MGRSNYLNVDCARSQEAYFAKIRAAAYALLTGNVVVTCPREGCEQTICGTRNGETVTLRCPSCGLIFRGSSTRLLQYYE